MATMYIAWHQYNRTFVAGAAMQTEGPFIASETIDISAGGVSGVAPGGAEYATVWADVPFEFALGASPTAVKGSTSDPYPANEPVQTPQVAGMKIAGIAI